MTDPQKAASAHEIARRVVGEIDTHGDPDVYTLAEAFLGLFQDHCERAHGNEGTWDTGCPVCLYVIRGEVRHAEA